MNPVQAALQELQATVDRLDEGNVLESPVAVQRRVEYLARTEQERQRLVRLGWEPGDHETAFLSVDSELGPGLGSRVAGPSRPGETV